MAKKQYNLFWILLGLNNFSFDCDINCGTAPLVRIKVWYQVNEMHNGMLEDQRGI